MFGYLQDKPYYWVRDEKIVKLYFLPFKFVLFIFVIFSRDVKSKCIFLWDYVLLSNNLSDMESSKQYCNSIQNTDYDFVNTTEMIIREPE